MGTGVGGERGNDPFEGGGARVGMRCLGRVVWLYGWVDVVRLRAAGRDWGRLGVSMPAASVSTAGSERSIIMAAERVSVCWGWSCRWGCVVFL